MTAPWRGPCAGIVDTLLEIDDLQPRDRSTSAARLHVEVCDHCRAELTAGLLVQLRLRRLGARLQTVEAPDDAWPRLRARIATAGAMHLDPDDPRSDRPGSRRQPFARLARSVGWLAVPLIIAGLLLPPAFDGQGGLEAQLETEASGGSWTATASTGAVIARSRITSLAVRDQSNPNIDLNPDASPVDSSSAGGLADDPLIRPSSVVGDAVMAGQSAVQASPTGGATHLPITR